MSDTAMEQIPGGEPAAEAVAASDEQLVAMLVDRARSEGLQLTGAISRVCGSGGERQSVVGSLLLVSGCFLVVEHCRGSERRGGRALS